MQSFLARAQSTSVSRTPPLCIPAGLPTNIKSACFLQIGVSLYFFMALMLPAALSQKGSKHPALHPAQDYDTQLQRALNYEDYDMANDIRQRRQSVDEAMDKLRVRLPDPLAKPPLHAQSAA